MSNEVIYDIIKNKDYIIRPFLFKIIKENNLDINETLLLIYLSNQEHPVLESFTSLTSKGLINTEIKKDGDKVIEEISLDGIYKLAAVNINKKVKKKQEKNIFELFESEFGRTLSPMEYEFINAWISSGMKEEIIKEALKEATYNGVSNLRYIDKIIYEWNKRGYKTVEQIRNNKYKKEDNDKKEVNFFELNYTKDYELLIATVLSAQCTDERVNKVTKFLFNKYNIFDLCDLDLKEIESIIYSCGNYKKKSIYIKSIANNLVKDFNGVVPNDRKYLESLLGVGRKTTNVVLSNLFNVPAIAVDTHVDRVSKRLSLSKKTDSVFAVEKKLMKKIPKEKWSKTHHQMVLFGRYICKSQNPKCKDCLLKEYCIYYKKTIVNK